MSCTGCGATKSSKARTVPQKKIEPQPLIVAASDDTTKKVVLRYYGGGMALKTTGCRSCGSTGKYTMRTTERIEFASDDAPNGWFSQTFTIGTDYYVTENQAKYLLSLTFVNRAGQVANKFKEVDNG